MSAKVTVDFPLTAEAVARHTIHNTKDAVEWIATAMGARPFQIRGDMQDGHYTDEHVITLAKKTKALGIDVPKWDSFSFYDYNALCELSGLVSRTERERVKRISPPLAVKTAG